MDYLDSKAKLDFNCPNCGHKVKQSLGGMQRDFNCPSCGATFDTAQFARDTKQVDKALKDFARDIKRMFK